MEIAKTMRRKGFHKTPTPKGAKKTAVKVVKPKKAPKSLY